MRRKAALRQPSRLRRRRRVPVSLSKVDNTLPTPRVPLGRVLSPSHRSSALNRKAVRWRVCRACRVCRGWRSEEHTSELQSQFHLVCRLLLEKKKKKIKNKFNIKKKKTKKTKK